MTAPPHGCEGSTLYHQNTRQLFYSGLANNSTRINVSLYISKDNGENWSFIKTIFQGPSAYSSMAILSDQSVGILFEGGDKTPYDSLRFTIIYNGTENKFY
jgi:sialidase-1